MVSNANCKKKLFIRVIHCVMEYASHLRGLFSERWKQPNAPESKLNEGAKIWCTALKINTGVAQ